jgi:hypothetical protein
MVPFKYLDWSRIDIWALAACSGVVAVAPKDAEAVRKWLIEEGYSTSSLDFQNGCDDAGLALGVLLKWEEQFGYRMVSRESEG